MAGDRLQYKPDFERAQTYWDALWNHEVIDRACAMATAAATHTILKAMAQARALYRQVYETFYQYGNKPKRGTTSNLPMYDRGRYNRIQEAGKIVILHLSIDDVKGIHGEYDPALLVHDVGAASVDEGLAFLEWMVDHT